MRKTANFFLICFTLHALAGLIVEGLAHLAGIYLPDTPVQILWLTCLASGLLVYIGLAFNRHLPLMVLLPPLLWMTWSLLDHWPMEGTVGSAWPLYVAIMQLIIALIMLQLNRLLNGTTWLLNKKQFIGPAFEGSRLLIFILINIVAAPLLCSVVLFSLGSNLLANGSGDFVQLRPNGLYMIEKTYTKANKQIQLISMIHMGRQQYYADLAASIPDHDTLILMEGVSDNNGLLNERFHYGKIAEGLGLAAQKQSHFQGRLIDMQQLVSTEPSMVGDIDLLPADIDLSRFDRQTIDTINAMAEKLLNNDNLLQGYQEFSLWASENLGEDFDKVVMNDLIDKRNAYLISLLPLALKKYNNIVIPWGALHMKGIEQALFEQGFEAVETDKHLSIDFLLLPFEKLWE